MDQNSCAAPGQATATKEKQIGEGASASAAVKISGAALFLFLFVGVYYMSMYLIGNFVIYADLKLDTNFLCSQIFLD